MNSSATTTSPTAQSRARTRIAITYRHYVQGGRQFVAFHGQDADGGEEQYIGQVEALMGTLSTGPKYRVNYFDAAEDDVGGCYKVCSVESGVSSQTYV